MCFMVFRFSVKILMIEKTNFLYYSEKTSSILAFLCNVYPFIVNNGKYQLNVYKCKPGCYCVLLLYRKLAFVIDLIAIQKLFWVTDRCSSLVRPYNKFCFTQLSLYNKIPLSLLWSVLILVILKFQKLTI